MTAEAENPRQVFRTVVAAELDALYRTALRMLRDHDEAEDAVQEALDKAWRKLDQFEAGTQMKSWVFRILSNTCLDHLRVRARRDSILFDPEAVDVDDVHVAQQLPDQLVSSREVGRRIEAEINRLSPAHRVVIQLVIVEQFTYEEAANALDLPIGTLRSRLSRARASLCSTLEDLLDEGSRKHQSNLPPSLTLVK